MCVIERTILHGDQNIGELRALYPNGLHFVVGDTHGEAATLKVLMQKIKFDPDKDHVYFVGDYNEGGNVLALLDYLGEYYQADYNCSGFHLIRGNHERELGPVYTLENLPDIIVIKGKYKNYYIVHAGMITSVFDLINTDMEKNPHQNIFAYRLDDICVQYDAPLRQIIWSRRGLYSQNSYWRNWPSESKLQLHKACIIHGHSPYCFFKHENSFSYGDQNLFWQQQHIFFSEDLQSFNIDSNVKGRFVNGESYRGLSCVCLEIIEEIASQNNGKLTTNAVKNAPNFVFAADYVFNGYGVNNEHIRNITESRPGVKRITLDEKHFPVIVE